MDFVENILGSGGDKKEVEMLDKIQLGGFSINLRPEQSLKSIVENKDSDYAFYLISKKQLKEIYQHLLNIIEATKDENTLSPK